jgi:hypothetical protein
LSAFVLDASVTAAWCFEDQTHRIRKLFFKPPLTALRVIVPAIWRVEVANVLVVAERRKKSKRQAP